MAVAAKVFQIIGIVFVLLLTLVFVFILPILGSLLKKANRALAERGGEFGSQVDSSIREMDTAQEQLEALGVMTASAKGVMESSIGFADRVIAFLNSKAFQVGFPAVLWFLLLAVAVPRGLFARDKRFVVDRVPPPSWEEDDD